MIGRIQRSADFERVLGSPSRARSSHFAVHHVAAWPSLPKKPVRSTLCTDRAELSTADAPVTHKPVDEKPAVAVAPAVEANPPGGCWLGLVVPKRNAKRSVTRSLLKRQIRAAFAGLASGALPAGLWVVRLRAPFDPKQYPSAASEALRAAARAELSQLVERLVSRSGEAKPRPARS